MTKNVNHEIHECLKVIRHMVADEHLFIQASSLKGILNNTRVSVMWAENECGAQPAIG